MPNAFNKEEIISRIKQKLDKQNIKWDVNEYKALTTTKVFMCCELCGEKYENFAHRLSDKICCICNNIPKNYDTKRIKKLLDEKLKNKTFYYLPFEYDSKLSTNQRITFVCKNIGCGHMWEAKINSILSKDIGCRQCHLNSIKLTKEKVIKILDEMNYPIRYFEYSNIPDNPSNNTKIKIKFLDKNITSELSFKRIKFYYNRNEKLKEPKIKKQKPKKKEKIKIKY